MGDGFEKNYIIAGVILILIFVILLAPKYFNKGDKQVKYKILESSEVPEKK